MHVLAISGSLRLDSHNTNLLRSAAPLAPPDASVVLWDGLKDVPPFDEDDEASEPAAVAQMRAAVAEADAILFATPEYNSSIPGQLKNAIDWLSRPKATAALRNKPVVVVGASTGSFGAVWAQADLRKVLAASGARVIEGDVAVGNAPQRFDEDGILNDADLREQLAEVLETLVEAARVRTAVAA